MSQKPVLRLVPNPAQSAASGSPGEGRGARIASRILGPPAKIAQQIGLGDPLTKGGWNTLKKDVLRDVRHRKMQRRSAAVLASSLLCIAALFDWQRHRSSPGAGAQIAFAQAVVVEPVASVRVSTDAVVPNGPLAEDALVRQIESLSKAGDRLHALDLLARYERDYPNSTRLHAVRHLAGVE